MWEYKYAQACALLAAAGSHHRVLERVAVLPPPPHRVTAAAACSLRLPLGHSTSRVPAAAIFVPAGICHPSDACRSALTSVQPDTSACTRERSARKAVRYASG